MFFGFGINEENQYIKQFDASEFDCSAFDEFIVTVLTIYVVYIHMV